MNVSVIIPTYNREKTIKRCLDSIIMQTIPPLEIIVVDDGSTDRTVEIIEEIGNIRVLRQNHRGAQAARNLGILNARGDYIAFLDSDDEWLPQMLERTFEEMAKHQGDIITYSDCYRIYDNQKKRIWNLPGCGKNSFNSLLLHAGPMFQSMLVKKELLVKIGFLDENVVAFQEWDTAIQLAREVEFIHIREPLFQYYVCNDDNISKDSNKAMRGYEYIIKKNTKEIIRIHGLQALKTHYQNLLKMAEDNRSIKRYVFVFAVCCINILIMIRKLKGA